MMSDIELGQTFDNAVQADWLAAVKKAWAASLMTRWSNDMAGYENSRFILKRAWRPAMMRPACGQFPSCAVRA